MRRAVVGAVLALAISACGGTTQSPAAPASPASAPPSTTAPASPPSEPPRSPSIAPSLAVSEPPVVTAWRRLEPGDGPDSREDHTWTLDPSTRTGYLFGGRDGATVYDDLWVFDLASDTWRELDPRGKGPAARFGHEAVWVDGVGLVVWPARLVRRPSSTTSGRTTPSQTTGRDSRTTGRSPSRGMARVRRSGLTGGFGSATASRRRASASPIRAPTTLMPAVDRRDPRRRPAGGALPARVLADRDGRFALYAARPPASAPGRSLDPG